MWRRVKFIPIFSGLQKEEPKKEQKVEVANGEAAKATETDKSSSKEETKEADNEDSLNLTIGEEDEKLLHDDSSNIESEKKGTWELVLG